MSHAVFGLVMMALLLSACTNHDARPEPALLMTPDAACVQQVQAFAERVTGAPVTLTDQIFQQQDTLLLEPQAALKLDGRVRGRPEMLVLRKLGNRCEVSHVRTGVTQQMADCSCQELTR